MTEREAMEKAWLAEREESDGDYLPLFEQDGDALEWIKGWQAAREFYTSGAAETFPRQLANDPRLGGERWEYAPGRVLRTHERGNCRGPHCVLHRPSNHHMRDWPLNWRGEGPFDISVGFERICPHGVGHPDPDCSSIPSTHGCDGCCSE